MPAPRENRTRSVIVRPAPPEGSGLRVATTRQGVLVDGGRATFTINSRQLRAVWEETWSGPQRRALGRDEVSDVVAAADDRAASGARTAKLELRLRGGGAIVPLRRRPWPEVLWVVARLREELGLQPREVVPEAPPAFEPSPLPVARVQKAEATPKPVASVEAVRRAGRLVVRLGALPTRQTDRGAWPVVSMLGTIGATLAVAGVIASAGDGGVRTPLVLLMLGALSLALAAWAVWMIALEAKTRYALHLSPRGLRVGRVEPRVPQWLTFTAKAPPERRRFLPRSQIAWFGPDGGPGASGGWQLYAYSTDEDRVSVLARRPHDELAWVGHLLTDALQMLPRGGAADGTPHSGRPSDAPSVLPYERLSAGQLIEIRHFPDGGVTVKVVPTQAEQATLVIPFLMGLFFLGLLARFVAHRADDMGTALEMLGLFAVALLAAGDVALMVWMFRRRAEPEVLGVDGEHLYRNDPRSFKPLTRWPRRRVRDVREGSGSGRAAGSKFVEIVIADDPTLRLFQGREAWDRRRIILALRKALAAAAPAGRGGAATTKATTP